MINSPQQLQSLASSLLIYQAVWEEYPGQAFLSLLKQLETREPLGCLEAYGLWFKSLAATGQSWQDYLLLKILRDENPFTQQTQQKPLAALPTALQEAARLDLQSLEILAQAAPYLREWVAEVSQRQVLDWNVPNHLTPLFDPNLPWWESLSNLALYYHHHGTGILAAFSAYRWQQAKLEGIAHPDPIQLGEIVGYEEQLKLLVKNTEFLLQGMPALHVLLYGSRGTGKSSLVKGLLNQYEQQGLRLIEVAKSDLKDLPLLTEKLRNSPLKFIIFVDDLSFEEDDEIFKALKVVLEGNLTAKAKNSLVYATSNRRHLVREFFADRPRPSQGEEVHSWDTMQEKLSFSDRFGLTLTFEPPNQSTYLKIVHHLAALEQVNLPKIELEFQALQWATRHNGRSGRTARQFIDFSRSELASKS